MASNPHNYKEKLNWHNIFEYDVSIEFRRVEV